MYIVSMGLLYITFKKNWFSLKETFISTCVCVLSHVQLLATLWTIACQAPLSVVLSRQEYWSGLPFPFPEDLPKPGIEPWSTVLLVDSSPSEPPGKPLYYTHTHTHTYLYAMLC